MTESPPCLTTLYLISDFPVDDLQRMLIRRLFTGGVTEAELAFGPNRKTCTWPLRIEYKGRRNDPMFELFLAAGFLHRHREVVQQLRDSGCNLELAVEVHEMQNPLSLSASVMQCLSYLGLQLTLQPVRGRQRTPSA